MNTKIYLVCLALLASAAAWAMPEENVRLVVSRGGENINGEEFLPADEAIADYVDNLPRPTQAFKLFKYDCVGKVRGYQATLNGLSTGATTSPGYGYAIVQMVYALHDCKQVGK